MATEHEMLLDERFRARDLALGVALESLEKRLDGMNEFREALRDNNNKLVTRTEVFVAIDEVRRKIEAYERPNYLVWMSCLSAVFILMGAVFVVIGLKIESATAPLSLAVATLNSQQLARTTQLETFTSDLHTMQIAISSSDARDAASKVQREGLSAQIAELKHDLRPREYWENLAANMATINAEAADMKAARARWLLEWTALLLRVSNLERQIDDRSVYQPPPAVPK